MAYYDEEQAMVKHERMQSKMRDMLWNIVPMIEDNFENPLEVGLYEQLTSYRQGLVSMPSISEIMPLRLLGLRVGDYPRLVLRLGEYYNSDVINAELFDKSVEDVVRGEMDRFALRNKIRNVIFTDRSDSGYGSFAGYEENGMMPLYLRLLLKKM
jgi:hypothetical protein